METVYTRCLKRTIIKQFRTNISYVEAKWKKIREKSGIFKAKIYIRVIKLFQSLILVILASGSISCTTGGNDTATADGDDQSKIVKRRRDDGTLTSVNPVDEDDYVHGVKVNFYEDGKTVHSKVSYDHGRKHGPAIWYYKNGQVYEHTNFHYGRKQGLTKRYYDSGELMEEFSYQQGDELPGKIKYNKAGQLIDQ